MAKSENNEVMFGARGKVGNLVVFKNFGNGKTIIAKVQRKRDNPVYSETQQIAKERFKEGVIYAKGVIQDPILYAFYKPYTKPGSSVYNMALADFCKPPEIKSINTDQDVFTIRVADNFAVVSVKVSILNPDGSLVESGLAVQMPNRADWLYTPTTAKDDPPKKIIKVLATDTPGNVSELVQNL